MNPSACLEINLPQLAENARTVTDWCHRSGIEIAGVVKAACGDARIARAFAEGGVDMLADSRLENIDRLRRAGLQHPLWLLRSPSPSQAARVVEHCDLSLNSELASLRALSVAAEHQGKRHAIILMVELGDRREGILPGGLTEMVARVQDLPALDLVGIGTNLGCIGGVRTTEHNLGQLVQCAERVERQLQHPLRYISGGNSGALPLLLQRRIPERINHLRIGFTILQGKNPFTDEPLRGLNTGLFTLNAELIEIQTKASVPEGDIVVDAFGQVPQFEDRGERIRGIVGLGRLDTDLTTLLPHDPGVDVLGASSDHLVLDLTEGQPRRVGDSLRFDLGYGASVQAVLSPYVRKAFIQDARADRSITTEPPPQSVE